MNFPIIELSYDPVPVDERMCGHELYDDGCVGYYTDFVGDEYTEEERQELLNNGRLQKLFAGIATINTADGGSITFLDSETIRASVTMETLESMDRLRKKAEEDEELRPDDVLYEAEYFRGDWAMFHYDGGVHTSGNLASSAVWFAGKTLYFGGIIRGHI